MPPRKPSPPKKLVLVHGIFGPIHQTVNVDNLSRYRKVGSKNKEHVLRKRFVASQPADIQPRPKPTQSPPPIYRMDLQAAAERDLGWSATPLSAPPPTKVTVTTTKPQPQPKASATQSKPVAVVVVKKPERDPFAEPLPQGFPGEEPPPAQGEAEVPMEVAIVSTDGDTVTNASGAPELDTGGQPIKAVGGFLTQEKAMLLYERVETSDGSYARDARGRPVYQRKRGVTSVAYGQSQTGSAPSPPPTAKSGDLQLVATAKSLAGQDGNPAMGFSSTEEGQRKRAQRGEQTYGGGDKQQEALISLYKQLRDSGRFSDSKAVWTAINQALENGEIDFQWRALYY